jgi:hypothetical protein
MLHTTNAAICRLAVGSQSSINYAPTLLPWDGNEGFGSYIPILGLFVFTLLQIAKHKINVSIKRKLQLTVSANSAVMRAFRLSHHVGFVLFAIVVFIAVRMSLSHCVPVVGR